MMNRREALAASAAIFALRSASAADADPTRVFPDGQKPNDVRLGPVKTLNDYFPFQVPKTKEEWEARRKAVREQVLVAEGLWPMPEKPPLNAVIHGKTEHDGYTIEKVSFVSTPGHYVTGNLYRPTKGDGKKPGVLYAHGHWKDGRFHDAGEKAAKASVDSGGESDMERGRFFIQAPSVMLARLGFVVFQYDMVGVADSTALTHREGFKDAQAELRLQSFMGLQTWNSIRALDFLLSLPDVDSTRIGMTGASGGGTQTLIMCAIDDRLTAAFPAVMVSTAMQGGCICENASHLRVGTGNIELVGVFAPKPLAMSAANDWTKELMTKGFPELQKLYELYGAKDKLAAKAWLEFPHNYNQKAREFMYAWFSKYLLGKDEQPKEMPYKPVPPAELSVYDASHPRPKDELNAADLRVKMAAASDAQMAKLFPDSAEKLKKFREVVRPALRVMMSCDGLAEVNGQGDFLDESIAFLPGGLTLVKSSFKPKSQDISIPIAMLAAKDNKANAVIWVHPQGKSSLFANGVPVPSVKSLLDAKTVVVAIDVFGTGELALPNMSRVDKTFAGYTYGYNRTVLANRVCDILAMIKKLEQWDIGPSQLRLVGFGEMGPAVVLAKALAGDKVTKTAADLNGFRFEDIAKIDDPMMLPGAVKYGGLGSFLALCAPGDVLVHNSQRTGIGRMSKAAYAAAGAEKKLTINGDKLDDAKVVEWLLK